MVERITDRTSIESEPARSEGCERGRGRFARGNPVRAENPHQKSPRSHTGSRSSASSLPSALRLCNHFGCPVSRTLCWFLCLPISGTQVPPNPVSFYKYTLLKKDFTIIVISIIIIRVINKSQYIILKFKKKNVQKLHLLWSSYNLD